MQPAYSIHFKIPGFKIFHRSFPFAFKDVAKPDTAINGFRKTGIWVQNPVSLEWGPNCHNFDDEFDDESDDENEDSPPPSPPDSPQNSFPPSPSHLPPTSPARIPVHSPPSSPPRYPAVSPPSAPPRYPAHSSQQFSTFSTHSSHQFPTVPEHSTHEFSTFPTFPTHSHQQFSILPTHLPGFQIPTIPSHFPSQSQSYFQPRSSISPEIIQLHSPHTPLYFDTNAQSDSQQHIPYYDLQIQPNFSQHQLISSQSITSSDSHFHNYQIPDCHTSFNPSYSEPNANPSQQFVSLQDSQSFDFQSIPLVPTSGHSDYDATHPPRFHFLASTNPVLAFSSSTVPSHSFTNINNPYAVDQPAGRTSVSPVGPRLNQPTGRSSILPAGPPMNQPAGITSVSPVGPPLDQPAGRTSVLSVGPPLDQPAGKSLTLPAGPVTQVGPPSQRIVRPWMPPTEPPLDKSVGRTTEPQMPSLSKNTCPRSSQSKKRRIRQQNP
ncbi:unnamed protein product [Allacma fusca]|uniref:Uncharacterized protein n=1 Tax=Allacma fusca TaxID=39272 RepID=A0A8J2P5M9_9HEXA|nr:unnamed protein product [Allacma fusca]